MSESFEDAMAFARKIAYCNLHREQDSEVSEWCDLHDNGNCEECTLCLINRLQRAHDHEMEQLRRLRFREGYVAGQRSMDAEHYQLKLRLQGLRFGDGSHENLSRLAYAIYPCPTGWGKESSEGLRDKIIEMLGGVHDEPAQTAASGCACDADCDCGNQQPQAVAYDVLGNERHKAVCELRKMRSCKEDYFAPELFFDGLYEALGCNAETDGDAGDQMCDRLIHLLGGDELLSNFCRTFAEPNLPKSAEVAKPESAGGCEVTITDELRKWASDNTIKDMVLTTYPEQHGVHGILEQLIAIADRIDQQHNDLQNKLDEYKRLFEHYRESYVDYVGRYNNVLKERDSLQASLRKIAERAGVPHDDDLDKYSDDFVVKATLAQIDSTRKYVGALEWQRDRQKKLLDEYDKMHVELPKDADGKCIHSGDLLEPATLSAARHLRSNPFEAKLFYGYLDGRYGINLSAPLDGGDAAVSPKNFRHATPEKRVESDADTAEDIVRDIHLGKVTDTQAVERIRVLP